jgi:hypothetical protein
MRDDSPSTDVATMPHPPAGRLLDRDELITPAELAAFLAVPVKTLRHWRYVGTGPDAFRVGRHLRYRPDSVRRWLEGCGWGEA